MDKLLLLTIILLSTFGCQKYEEIENPHVTKQPSLVSQIDEHHRIAVSQTFSDINSFELIRSVYPEFTLEEYNSIERTENAGYGASDLLNFLESHGTVVDDITPAFHNYHQNITNGGSYLGHVSLINGEDMFDENEPTIATIDTLNYRFEWYLNGELITELSNPRVYNFSDIECDGVMQLTLSIEDVSSGAKFSRTEWSYFDFNDISTVCNNSDTIPNQFDVFYEFHPIVEPYHYMTECATWDLNCDGMVALADLMIFLVNYGPE